MIKYIILLSAFSSLHSTQYIKSGYVSDELSTAIAFVESSFIEGATSHKGAKGYWQITDIACKDVGIDCRKPDLITQYRVMNAFILKWYKKTKCIYKTLDIYNRGYGNVKKYPYKGEYKKHPYIGRILSYLKEIKKFNGEVPYKKIKGFKRIKNGFKIVYKK